ncbi:uncharacterized protein KY384_002486 [Bacidia gigantensis]|uniref:uncharacterized protein n=1 Tax=Bacidia gigantensis TaxID=2732470 RepID=UPI001D03EF9B|nr:uncharacterized protein KY384_002486 [Bacidia gigantensis]KAG8532609.1 hypothetical protein KY384_002486 [Bacidia gigantensis]
MNLVQLELHALMAVSGQVFNFVFVGSGPLPLTAFCVLEAFERYPETAPLTCCNIDKNQRAIQLSDRMRTILSLNGKAMHFECTDIENDEVSLEKFDVIYLAALVGDTAVDKVRILSSVASRMRAEALIVIRSAHQNEAIMSSFKKQHVLSRPRDYVTPSPPLHAVEPLSPVLPPEALPFSLDLSQPARSLEAQDKTNGEGSNSSRSNLELTHHVHRCTGSMEIFASIALATSPPSQLENRPSKRILDGNHEWARPAKRSKSEKLPSPESSRKTTAISARPVTSWEQPSESRLREAELLLHFSQSAVSRSSSVMSPHSDGHGRRMSNDPPFTPHNTFRELPQAAIQSFEPHIQPSHQERSQEDLQEHIENESTMLISDNKVDKTTLPPTPKPSLKDSPTIRPSQPDPLPAKPPESVVCRDGWDLPSASHDINEKRQEFPEIPKTSDPNGDDKVSNDVTVHLDRGLYGGPLEHASLQPNERGETSKPEAETSTMDTEAKLDEHGDSNSKASPVESVNDGMSSHLGLSDDQETIQQLAAALGEATGATRSGIVPKSAMSRTATAVCAACNFAKNSLGMEGDQTATSWISCDGCKSWFHFACAGFKNEREVRGVDKYRCRKCKSIHGATTYVRKSSRAHTAIDYAGLHQGVIKTSDDRPEHHYIQPMKEGTISFMPENFARMRPELVTAEFFEKGGGMKDPIVIPAELNPRPTSILSDDSSSICDDSRPDVPTESADLNVREKSVYDSDLERAVDHGQDGLDMVMPQDLTVRRVAELYGPEEKVEVIDVKSQNGEGKKWNMRRWADYYENKDDNKIVRNVISLEVSQSPLGRLIRRPQIVRDLDLQDAVWPEDLKEKGEYPHVQFYCLMSVADCFTDFHIDFGGSSVFYHILKGSKTFLFIPPKEKNLKKYEEWCMSPAQNWTFLPDQTKECYRVDLKDGDTMLIPSGWIHAVWTPQDSLVIGGNFLTRMNFGMQLRIAQVEKNTGVARKFRYPHFQKLHWFTVFRYLEEDPMPSSVKTHLESGFSFERQNPAYYDFDNWGENSTPQPENYHAKYYSQPELDGLPELVKYILRTVLIDMGAITEGVSAETRNAVKKSIPRSHGDPLDVVKTFAIWCAWKRGNEPIPHWAYPDALVETAAPDKLSAAASKKLAEEAALKAPRRQSARMQSQREGGITSQIHKAADEETEMAQDSQDTSHASSGNRSFSQTDEFYPREDSSAPAANGPKMNGGIGSHRKTACDSCRRRRRACKHKTQLENHNANLQSIDAANSTPSDVLLSGSALQEKLSTIGGLFDSIAAKHETSRDQASSASVPDNSVQSGISPGSAPLVAVYDTLDMVLGHSGPCDNGGAAESMSPSRPRTKACNHCRKSKRRCIHDAFGNEDPIKVAETAIPRPHARKTKGPESSNTKIKVSLGTSSPNPISSYYETPARAAPVANMLIAPVAKMGGANEVTPETSTDDGAHETHLIDSSWRAEARDDGAQTLPVDAEAIAVDSALVIGEYSVVAATEDHRASKEVTLNNLPAYSLVSPPASAHDANDSDLSTTQITPTKSRPQSRQLSPSPREDFQRYTPESASIGGASHSSAGESHEEVLSKAQQTRSLSTAQADEDSLKLIKELQAQDLGLRRRNWA